MWVILKSAFLYLSLFFSFFLFYGNCIVNLISAWWKATHNIHHSLPNCIQYDPDIQHLPVLAVCNKYFNSLYSFYHHRVMYFNRLGQFFVSYQHILYYPIMCLARFNLYAQSAAKIFVGTCDYRWVEITSTLIFWTWMTYLHSFCLSWPTMFACFLVCNGFTGLLHVQITQSHFAMEMLEQVPYKNDSEQFLDTQLRTTMDIACPEWLDWFHGGLQFQAAHHLYPRVPRHNLRIVQHKIINMCKR